MRSRRLTRGVLAVSAAATTAALGHACSDDPTGPDGSLPVVADLTVQPIATGRMRLSWSNLEGASGYAIERRRDLTGEFDPLTEIDAPSDSAVTYVDTEIDPLTFYGYRVRTTGGRLGGLSRPSEIAGARSLALPGIEVRLTLDAPDPSTADTDGFQIRLEGPEPASAPIAAGDTVLLSPLAAGTYTLTLEDVAPTCTVDDGASREVAVADQPPTTVSEILLEVSCRDSSNGGIVVEVSVQGDTTDTDGVRIQVFGDSAGTGTEVYIEDTLHPAPGETATTQNADLLNLKPGIYEVSLRDFDTTICLPEGETIIPDVEVIAPQNDTTRFALTCTINQRPSADAGGPYAGKAGTPIQFNAEGSSDSDGSIASYTWNFGDDSGAPGQGDTPTHAYEAEGTFTAVLTVTDERGGTDVNSAEVTVGPPNERPIARVTGPRSGDAGAQLAFNASESSDPDGEIAGFAWDFGDGTFDDGETVKKTFATSDTYTVTVTVTDNDGGTDTASMEVAITDSPNEPPVAEAGGPYTGVLGQPVEFDGSSSKDPDGGAVARYEWQFGDGHRGSGVTPQHTYQRAGAFTVVLTVFDNQGAIAFDTASVNVDPDPNVNQPPIAQVNVRPRNGTVNKPLLFNAGDSFDPDGRITSYAWDFGDGTQGTRLVTSHAYAEPGQYTVRLTVTDDQGLTATDSGRVTIVGAFNRPPIANASGASEGLVNELISFSAAGSTDPDGEIVRFHWHFGDGSEASGVTISHAYTGTGTYRVALTVTDDVDAIDADTITVVIRSTPSNAPPTADAGGPYTGTVGAPITLDGSASDFDGTIESFDWDFNNDGVFDDASGENPEFTCSDVGTFPVVLQVTDDDGATATDDATVDCTDNLPPTADAGGSYDGVVGAPITFDGSGSSDPDGTIESFEWEFGDGELGTGANPMHAYAEPGTYTAVLTVTDDQGATATDQAEVTITSGGPGGPTGDAGTVRGRWVDETGAPITQTTVGSTIFFEIDIEMDEGSNISSWQAVLLWDAPLLAATTQGEDLNCSNPGGQATCPSGPVPAGNVDNLEQYIGNNNTRGQLSWLSTNFTGANGVGIQGLGRFQFTADRAGTVNPELHIDTAFGDNDTTDLNDDEGEIVVNIPPLTIEN